MIFKNTKPAVCFLFIITLLSASCSSPDSSLSGIPAESSFVSVIDVYSLIKKGEIEKVKESKFFKDGLSEVRDESKKMSDLLKKAMKDPSSTGIDFTSDLVNFSMNEYKGENFTCGLMGLSDEDDFKKFLTTILDESKLSYEILNKETHSYIELNRERNAIAWDSEKVVVIGANDYKSRENLAYQANRLFILEEDGQLISNESFQSFLNNKEDISMWVSSNMLPNMIGRRAYKRMEEDIDFDLKDNIMMGHISFDEGEIVMNTSIEMNEDLKKKYGNNKTFQIDFNENLLELFPKEHLFMTSFSLDTEKAIEALKEDEKYEEMVQQYTRESGMDRRSMEETIENMKSFKGSFLFSVFDVENVVIEPDQWLIEYYKNQDREAPVRNQFMPQMGMAFDIEEGEFVEKMKEELASKRENGYYHLKENRIDFYIGYRNSIAFVTNSKSKMENFINSNNSSQTMASSDVKSEILDNLIFAQANLEYDKYPEALKDEMEKFPNSRERNIFDKWKRMAKKIEMKNTSNNSFEMRITLSEEDQNSLSTILQMFD